MRRVRRAGGEDLRGALKELAAFSIEVVLMLVVAEEHQVHVADLGATPGPRLDGVEYFFENVPQPK
jgi:hypothetical protein